MTEAIQYKRTDTSLTYKDSKTSYNVPALSYMAIRQKYLFLAKLKAMPKQYIGTTYLNTTAIKLEQDGRKYELGAAYKLYLSDNLYVAPAFLYSNYASTLYQTVGNSVIKTKTRDNDLSLYGLLGYKPLKATTILVSLELDNDILSNCYSKDYSQYIISTTIHQFFSKNWFAYIKYRQTLRDKVANTESTGNTHSISYGAGIGIKF